MSDEPIKAATPSAGGQASATALNDNALASGETGPTVVAAQQPPMSAEALVDLRRRVLANEPVSDDELRHALSSLAMARGTAPTGAKAATAVYEPKGSIADRFAAFKAKVQHTDAAGGVVVEPKKGDGSV